MQQYVIDIGNTRIKGAAFAQGQIIEDSIRNFDHSAWSDIYREITNHSAKNLIYSTVANVPPSILLHKLQSEGRKVHQLNHRSPLPFVNHYESPETLGKDRVAAVAGAVADFAEEACLVVDAGTCMTIDYVNSNGEYLGGSISPGLRMRLLAMNQQTARLPLVEPDGATNLQILGTTTEKALLSGGVLGVVAEINGVFHRLSEQQQLDHILLTGGDAPTISQYLQLPHKLLPNLVLTGLNKILTLYADKSI